MFVFFPFVVRRAVDLIGCAGSVSPSWVSSAGVLSTFRPPPPPPAALLLLRSGRRAAADAADVRGIDEATI